MIDSNELRLILPYAYPFLLIDRVDEFEVGKRLVAIKNITGNEWPVCDTSIAVEHFPEVLLIEAAAQAAIVLYHVSKIKNSLRKPQYFLGRIDAQFSQKAMIGEVLTIEVSAGKMLDTGGYVDAKLNTTTKKIAEIEIIYKVFEKSTAYG